MTTIAEIRIDPENAAAGVQQAIDKGNAGAGEAILDFSAVRRIDTQTAAALEQLASAAGSAKITLRGVNGDIYKVLKLLRLTARFSFVA